MFKVIIDKYYPITINFIVLGSLKKKKKHFCVSCLEKIL